jgi:PAS domain S-box-containing protein
MKPIKKTAKSSTRHDRRTAKPRSKCQPFIKSIGEGRVKSSASSEFRAFDAISQMPVMMWVAELSGARTFNKAWFTFTGRSPDQEDGDGWRQHIHPDDERHCVGTYLAALASRRRFRTEYRVKARTGDYRWILETGVPQSVRGRSAGGYVGSAIEITDRRRAKELDLAQIKFWAMVATEQPINQIFEFLAKVIEALSDKALSCLMLLEEDSQHLKLGMAPNLPKSFIREIDRLEIRRGNGSCATAAIRRRPVVVTSITENPLWKNLKEMALAHGLNACASVPILSKGGLLGTFAFYYADIRKPGGYDMRLLRLASQLLAVAIDHDNHQTALQNAEQKYRSIFENAVEGIFQTTPDGGFTAANPAMARILGFSSPEELISSRIDIKGQHYVQPERRAQFQRLIDTHGKVEGFEIEVYRKDGSTIWTSENVRVVRDENGKPLYYEGTLEDITERKVAQEARRELLLRIVTAQEDEQRRLSRELHDQMAQHLTAVTLGLKSLEIQTSGDSVDLVKRLQNFANKMAREVRTIATQLRPLVLEDLGLDAALSDYVDEWSKQSDIRVDLHCNGLLRRRLSVDAETAVYRIVQEALTNISKHAEAERASVIVDTRSDHIRAIIEDDGCGFDFAQKMRTLGRDRRLGLINMRERAAVVGGTLNIESTPGIGTTVILKVPV